MSFLEAFSYGKPVISCQDPDGLVSRFGYYAGELLGDGHDEKGLEIFSKKAEEFLNDKIGRLEKGRLARSYVEQNHSFPNFEMQLKEILEAEQIN